MARCPLPVILPRSPIPPQILCRIQLCLLHIPCPQLQVDLTSHGASQWGLWRGHGTVQQNLYPDACAVWPPHLLRLRCTEYKGKAVRFQPPAINKKIRGHGIEEQPSYPWPLQNGTDSVHYMCVMNTDAKFHLAKSSDNFLHKADRAKKNIYL